MQSSLISWLKPRLAVIRESIQMIKHYIRCVRLMHRSYIISKTAQCFTDWVHIEMFQTRLKLALLAKRWGGIYYEKFNISSTKLYQSYIRKNINKKTMGQCWVWYSIVFPHAIRKSLWNDCLFFIMYWLGTKVLIKPN